MILDQLLAFRERIPTDDEIPAGYKRQAVRWMLTVAPDGRVLGVDDLGTGKDATRDETPYVNRTSATKPLLLVDKPGYVLGIPEGETPKHAAKATERHAAYLALLDAAAEATGDADVARLAATLRDEAQISRARDLLTAQKWKPGDLIMPRIRGEAPHGRAAIRRFWQSETAGAAAEKSRLTAECLGCGNVRPIVRTHPVELLVGPDRVGMVTGNASAFLSHGLEQSEIAPMCADCARAYGEALRFLLQSPEHHLRVGDATWLFWTKNPASSFPFGRAIEDPTEADVRSLLRSPQAGQEVEADADAFYALVVSSNKSRLVVRSWLTLSVGEAKQNLRDYFERQRVAGYDGTEAPLKLRALAGATVRALKDVQPSTYTALLEHALTGRRLPATLLLSALRRAAVEEHPVTRPRAALLRLALASQNVMTTPALDPDHTSAAYHCGRLLAVLDKIQRKAISPKATLVDRFYGSASTSPATVFGTLLRKAQPHLAVLRKSRGGKDHYLDGWLGDISKKIESFPRTLSPEEQGLFALGFYHQKYKPYDGPDADSGDTSETDVASTDA